MVVYMPPLRSPKHNEAIILYYPPVNHPGVLCVMELRIYSLKQQYKTLRAFAMAAISIGLIRAVSYALTSLP